MASNTHDAGHGAADAAQVLPACRSWDFSTYGNQIFWLLVTLVVIYLILSRVALPRIAAILNERTALSPTTSLRLKI